MGPETEQVTQEPKPFDIVVVEWVDAYADSTAQYETPDKSLASYKPALRRTVGFWGGQSDEVVVVCTDDDRCTEAPSAIAGGMYIPQGMVVSLTIISEDDRTVPA